MSAIPFAITIIPVLFGGWFGNQMRKHLGFSLAAMRKTLAAVALLVPAVTFVAVGYVRSPTTALFLVCIMYAANGLYVVGIAENVLDIAPRFAGSVMAVTHTVSTSSGIIANVATGLALTEYAHFETAFTIAGIVSAFSAAVYCAFSSQEVLLDEHDERDEVGGGGEVARRWRGAHAHAHTLAGAQGESDLEDEVDSDDEEARERQERVDRDVDGVMAEFIFGVDEKAALRGEKGRARRRSDASAGDDV